MVWLFSGRMKMQEKTNALQEEIERYRRIIKAGFDYKLTKLIDNGMPEHAAVLYEQFFVNAEDIVRIFCKNLSKQVFEFPFVVDAARRAIKKGVTIDILLQDENPERSCFSLLLQDYGIKPLHITEEELRITPANFSVMDRRAFRYEKDREHFTAKACAYDPEIASRFADRFDSIKAVTRGC